VAVSIVYQENLSGSVGNLTWGTPATAGNVLSVFYAHRDSGTPNEIAGWTLDPNYYQSGGFGDDNLVHYYKVADGGETTIAVANAGTIAIYRELANATIVGYASAMGTDTPGTLIGPPVDLEADEGILLSATQLTVDDEAVPCYVEVLPDVVDLGGCTIYHPHFGSTHRLLTGAGTYQSEVDYSGWGGFPTAHIFSVIFPAVDAPPPPPPPICRPMQADVYQPGVPSGDPTALTFLATLCGAFKQWLIDEELGPGSGGFTINRYDPDATAAVLGAGGDDARLVKIRIADVADAPIFAWWLERGAFTLLDSNEEGAENLVFAGRGALAYLARGVMAPRSYLTDPYDGIDPRDGVWRFERPDLPASLAFLASARNATGSLVDTWQLPAVNPSGDDVLLVAFVQLRANEDVTPPAGWTERVSQDTSLGGAELRYLLADKIEATGPGPYADTFESDDPARWTAAQLAFRSTGAATSNTGSEHQAESSTEATITATYSGATTAGNILLAYVTLTTVSAAGTPGGTTFEWPPGWTQLLTIPNGNTYTGVAAVGFKPADGTETGVTVIVRDDTEITSTSLLIAEYPILYSPLKAGEILWLVCRELMEVGRPDSPVPILTLDFTYELDSNGDPWDETAATGAFTANVGENVLAVVQRLIDTGEIVVVMGPDLVLHAYNRSTYGRDLTGAAFGAGIVRLVEGLGLSERLTRERQEPRGATHVFALGDEDTFAHRALPDADDRVTREVAVRVPHTVDAAALAGVGDAELANRQEHFERLSVTVTTPKLEETYAAAALEGRYFPGPEDTNGHFWPGDVITVDSGSGPFDLDEEDLRIAAVAIKEGDELATSDSRDLEVVARLLSNKDTQDADIGGSGVSSPSSGSVVAGGDHGAHTGLTDDDHPQYLLRSEFPDIGDHGALTGLGDDDHPQYLLESIVDAKGDIITATADNTPARLPVGGDEADLIALAAETTGQKWRKNTVTTTDPTTGDDSGDGYRIGSRWLNTTDDTEFVCLDATVAAAVWVETTGGGGASALDDLTDVILTSPATGEALVFDGSDWVNDTIAAGASVTVEEEDGSPSDVFDTIRFPSGTLIDNGDGSVSVRQVPTGFIGAQVHHNTTTSSSPLPFNTKDYDTDGFWATGANTKFTVPAGMAGKYRITFWGLATGSEARVRKNGATPYIGPNTPNGAQIWNVSFDADLLAGDYIEVVVTGSTWGHASASEAQITLQIAKLDSGKVGSGVGAKAYNSTTQAINSTTAALTFDSDEFDTDGFHDTGANTSRMTIPPGMAGLYLVTAAAFASNSAMSDAWLRLNGTTRIRSNVPYASGGGGGSPFGTAILSLVAGDYVEMMITTVGSENFGSATTGEEQAVFTIMRLDSPAGGVLKSDKASRTSGDLTTTSTTLVDATGMSITLITGARRCLVVVNATGANSSAERVILDLEIDGVAQGQTYGLAQISLAATETGNLSFAFLTDVLAAGSHTIKLRWRVTGGTGTLNANTSTGPLVMEVQEMPDSGLSAAGSLLAADRKTLTTGDKTTSSGTFGDIDSGLNITLTTGARRVLLIFEATVSNSGSDSTNLDIDIDGTRQGLDRGLVFVGGASHHHNGTMVYLTDVLTPGPHTFKPQFATLGGTSTVRGGTSTFSPAKFSAQEMPDTGLPAPDVTRVVRGAVNADGTTRRGSGFSAVNTGTGAYLVTFDVPFTQAPIIVAGSDEGALYGADVGTVTASTFVVRTGTPGVSFSDRAFDFIAVAVTASLPIASTPPIAILQDQKSQNTSGGTFTSGAWRTRDLNTEVSDGAGIVALSSNQFTPIAGTYRIHVRCPAYGVERNQSRLQNVTAATTTITGSSTYGSPGGSAADEVDSIIEGIFTANGTDAFEVQHRCQTTNALGFGVEANFGTEVYTTVVLERIA